jgi:predicted DNA-binding mobile mystery protein A
MGVTQFARRLKIKPPSVSDLERGEMEGTITLNSLRRAADALDCTLVYALVPSTTLTAAVQEQARHKAREARSSVSHSMALEAQGIDPLEAERQENELMQRLLIEWPRNLWDDDDRDETIDKSRNDGG